MKSFGKPLLVVGVIILVIAFNMDTSVESGYGRIHNIGLLSRQSNYFVFGSILLVAGLLLIGMAKKDESTSDSEQIKCPFCAELIKKEAKICRYCKSEIGTQVPEVALKAEGGGIEYETITVSEPEELEPKNLDRSLLNKTYSEEINSTQSEDQIRAVLANELRKIHHKFNGDRLNCLSGNKVVAEASIQNNGGGNWAINVNYNQEKNAWVPMVIILVVFIYSIVADKNLLFVNMLLAVPVVGVFRLIYSSRFTEKRIRVAMKKLRYLVK